MRTGIWAAVAAGKSCRNLISMVSSGFLRYCGSCGKILILEDMKKNAPCNLTAECCPYPRIFDALTALPQFLRYFLGFPAFSAATVTALPPIVRQNGTNRATAPIIVVTEISFSISPVFCVQERRAFRALTLQRQCDRPANRTKYREYRNIAAVFRYLRYFVRFDGVSVTCPLNH